MSNFFSTVSTFATPFAKAGKTKDPLAVAKTKFATVADEQIKLLKAGAAKGFCFSKHGNGFVLTLKNGATMLNAAQPSFAVGTVDDAVKFFEGAKAAAQAGEFDALFTQTMRKVKDKTAAVVVAADSTAANEVDHSASNAVIAAVVAEEAPVVAKQKRK